MSMDPLVSRVLRMLQNLSQARIGLSCLRLHPEGPAGSGNSERELQQRITQGEQAVRRLLASMDVAHRSEARVSRALFLQSLLESAPQRLQAWSDQDPLDRMPPSRLFEWTSHDHERLELAQLESQMTPEEAARYISTLQPI